MAEKLRIGVFGVWRGYEYIRAVNIQENAEIVAICDKDEEKLEEALKICPPGTKVCKDYDELLKSGIDAVILCNYFHEHAPYAIKALKSGVHVLSETQSAVTMKQCVELVEAAEETGKQFVLAENYPFFRCNMEMRKIYQSGEIGDVVFAEGEYIHPMSRAENTFYNPDPTHWRTLTPCTYYCTHALAPLMYITDEVPVKVIGKVARSAAYAEDLGSSVDDNYGVLLCEMTNGSVFRVGACGAFGPKGNWYRLGCSRGGVESVRGQTRDVRLSICPWFLNEKNSSHGAECVYTPVPTEESKKAEGFEHDGADFWVVKTFCEDILAGRQPYMDVYRSAALAAVGILGWESAVENSVQLEIPDFKNREEREKYRNDDRSPYDKDGKPSSLPHYLYRHEAQSK
ncbi:MAG: Gfo/Idh/MocA family oxidoreductase [Eubacteriales bacterium]|nr:Gfo/Idh/MocA family oxidoreductase [Eubacteriales bacterium]